MMARLRRRSCSLSFEMSSPSITTLPLSNSQMRNSAIMSELLPAPVRPQIPTFSPPRMSILTPRNTSGSSGRYLRHRLSNLMAPCEGHTALLIGVQSGASSSCGIFRKCSSRSTLVMALSTWSADRVTHCTTAVNINEYVSERPAVIALSSPFVDTRYAVTMTIITTDSMSSRAANHRPADQYVMYMLAFSSTTFLFRRSNVSRILKARIVCSPDSVSLKRL
ncbi:hypothetical protein PPTG_25022 [Phytophthora nicotianae INRA-310]|uniref:Uncharacterized protein n=1 Tax=Phytophthora nicotianae (strain INRA-310) TaxID=761204 RepID=W2PBE2_PHYN3|nr:hypothetical protein PPTG_25022 [Phytophthora nicotianae INRA-310]ETM97289.1 hypothetical protein PPTG_25022 [Phytophthora nicotianae INRA-310]